MRFLPPDFDVPELLEIDRFRIRPLTIHDVVKDYGARWPSPACQVKPRVFGGCSTGANAVLNPARLTKLPGWRGHPFGHPDDPRGPFLILLDRRATQREQPRCVWSRPDRR
jgi:hypothetical protein